MKKIGIIGGLGPESTLDYYKGIIDAFKPSYNDNGYPEIVIESLDLKSFVELGMSGDWASITEILAGCFNAMWRSGAEFGAIASNTPHRVFDDVQSRTELPLISIVNATCDYSKHRGIESVCLLGTAFTMRADFYKNKLAARGIETVVPAEDEIDYIQEKLFTEIELGIIKPETKQRFLEIINRIRTTRSVQGLILGCTELPLIIKPNDTDLEYINTTQIHIDAIVKHCIGAD